MNAANLYVDASRSDNSGDGTSRSTAKQSLQNGQPPWNNYNLGGGGVCDGTLFNCAIIDNTPQYNGGGACYSTLINCILSGNHTDRSYGGGAYSAKLVNCTVTTCLTTA
ncbi:MAG: hypothetical protein PHO37_03320 [Kiritimatiellae bacterium]|nr:hypothetical protein [Kiritimatiellia bacterium]